MARSFLTLAALLLVLPCSLAQAEDGFRLRQLNPFHQEEEAAPTASARVIGTPDYRAPVTPPEPSFFDRVGESTRSTFGRVSDAIRAPFQSRETTRTASRESWFQFPWNQPEQNNGPSDVNEFLDLERPRY